ncbi:Nitrous oxide-stimulated promoter [Pilibacter termitis]|uniref:Nitrous oxide-stimulated promoter n=1 Tax=Pilibacter termitis TaxID=263852 RepID=A0A1T4L0M5_9ENTE|nr:nitrous oxide-stimulated promoter family protein [Pilibacter termitis]SJZ48087.1 Nitrous oxide-stimulated promoter [Pilibacter termitis]
MMKKNTGPIIQEEIELIGYMIDLYYKKNKADIPKERMAKYAKNRLEFCQFGERKTTCKKCPVHCYQEVYRNQMKKIMRYSGPRMLIYHPILTFRHELRGVMRKL